MKKIMNVLSKSSFGLLLLFVSASTGAKAKSNEFNVIKNNADTITISFKVNGTLACKSNIEASVTTHAGIITANWAPDTKIITVKFLAAQIKTTNLYSYIALAGFDNSELRAKQVVYDNLSDECKYYRDPESE